MRKLTIAFLIMLPLIGFSQNEQNGFAFFKNPNMDAKSFLSKRVTTNLTIELPIYNEDDLKLYGGSRVLEMMYLLVPKENTITTIHHNKNSKANDRIAISYSGFQPDELPIYCEDDLKLYGGSKVLEMMYPTITTGENVRTIHYDENPKIKENTKINNSYTSAIQIYDNPKFYYEIGVNHSDIETMIDLEQLQYLQDFRKKLRAINQMPQ